MTQSGGEKTQTQTDLRPGNRYLPIYHRSASRRHPRWANDDLCTRARTMYRYRTFAGQANPALTNCRPLRIHHQPRMACLVLSTRLIFVSECTYCICRRVGNKFLLTLDTFPWRLHGHSANERKQIPLKKHSGSLFAFLGFLFLSRSFLCSLRTGYLQGGINVERLSRGFRLLAASSAHPAAHTFQRIQTTLRTPYLPVLEARSTAVQYRDTMYIASTDSCGYIIRATLY